MTKDDITILQTALRDKGFYKGVCDGIWGQQTIVALIDFKKSVGLRPRDHVGPLTRAALLEDRYTRMPFDQAEGDAEPVWLRLARTYLGLQEYPGNRHNPKILEWWSRLRLPFRDDETPWCAAFVCGVLEEAGIRSTRSAAARSFHWSQWGQVLDGPAVGAVASLWRGARKGASGHVGFIVGRDHFGHLMILGGNQGNRVSILAFNVERLLSCHWPAQEEAPEQVGFATLPVLESNGRISHNEI